MRERKREPNAKHKHQRRLQRRQRRQRSFNIFFAIQIMCYQLKCPTAIPSGVLYLRCVGCWTGRQCVFRGSTAEHPHTRTHFYREEERKIVVIALSFSSGSEPFFLSPSCKCQHFSHNGFVGNGFARLAKFEANFKNVEGHALASTPSISGIDHPTIPAVSHKT